MNELLRMALECTANCSINLLLGPRGADMDYADGIVLLGEDPQVVHGASN